MTDERPPHGDFKKLIDSASDGSNDSKSALVLLAKAFQHLSEDLETERERNKEQRFLFIVVFIVFLNAFVIEHVTSIGAMLVILVPEIVVILVLANRLGQDVIFTWLTNAMNFYKPKD